MFKSLFSLAAQGTMRKRSRSILAFLVLMVSFSFAIVTMSLTQSISTTNDEYRQSSFGEWYLAILAGTDADAEWLAQQSWAEDIGKVRVYGTVMRIASSGDPQTFGTADEAFLHIGHIELLDGRMPQKENEVVLSESVLQEWDYADYTLGQEVKIALGSATSGADTGGNRSGVKVGFTFTLCGVMKDYNSLWNFASQGGDTSAAIGTTRPPCVLMTEETAQYCQKSMSQKIQQNLNASSEGVVEQYYVCVREDSRQEAAQQTAEYMKSTRESTQSSKPCVNSAAYPATEEGAAPDTLYACLIAAVALVAVLCVYLMNLSAEVHSFAVLRSIGITKGQLLMLMGLESLFLVVPAVVLGIPLGVGLTKLALRLLVYSNSVPIRASIPRGTLWLLFALWLLVIVLVRLIVFFVTVRTPLTGKMQMQGKKAHTVRCLRRVLIALLLLSFGASVAYTASESRGCSTEKRYWESNADYVFSYLTDPQTGESSPIPLSAVARLDALPGVEHAEGYMQIHSLGNRASKATIEFEGIEERSIEFFMVDEEMWADTLNLGKDAEAFHNGELVMLCFRDSYTNENREKYTWDGPMPTGDVTLRAYEDGTCVAQLTATPKIWRMARSTQSRILSFQSPYSVVCSEAYLRKLLDTMAPGTTWDVYTAGEEFGYQRVWLTTDSNAKALSIDSSINTVVRQEKLSRPESRREENEVNLQAATQSVILLYACGGCVALVTLLLLAGALALEADQERRSYTILRVIGMSLRQMRRRVFGKALVRSVLAVAAGWAAYLGFLVFTRPALRERALDEALSSAWRELSNGGAQMPFLTILSTAMLAILLTVSLLSKCGLKQSTLLK